jgi:hypothetical protein
MRNTFFAGRFLFNGYLFTGEIFIEGEIAFGEERRLWSNELDCRGACVEGSRYVASVTKHLYSFRLRSADGDIRVRYRGSRDSYGTSENLGAEVKFIDV